MSTQGGLARKAGDVAGFADDDPLLSPDDRAPYELTDLGRAYLRALTDSGGTAAREEAG